MDASTVRMFVRLAVVLIGIIVMRRKKNAED